MCICIRVAAVAEEIVYEVVVEPQGPQGQALPQEVHKDSTQDPAEPSVEQQPEGKPRCMPYNFKFMTPIYVFLILVH